MKKIEKVALQICFIVQSFTILAAQNYKNFMGRGDKKTAKGKRKKGSFGVTRNKKAIKTRLRRVTSRKPSADVAAAPAKAKRAPAKKKGE
jgi:ribosomal small subunit protein bTHX